MKYYRAFTPYAAHSAFRYSNAYGHVSQSTIYNRGLVVYRDPKEWLLNVFKYFLLNTSATDVEQKGRIYTPGSHIPYLAEIYEKEGGFRIHATKEVKETFLKYFKQDRIKDVHSMVKEVSDLLGHSNIARFKSVECTDFGGYKKLLNVTVPTKTGYKPLGDVAETYVDYWNNIGLTPLTPASVRAHHSLMLKKTLNYRPLLPAGAAFDSCVIYLPSNWSAPAAYIKQAAHRRRPAELVPAT